jgi:hypothetical protein
MKNIPLFTAINFFTPFVETRITLCSKVPATPNLFYIIMNTHTSKLQSKKVYRTSLSIVTFVDRTVLTESDS